MDIITLSGLIVSAVGALVVLIPMIKSGFWDTQSPDQNPDITKKIRERKILGSLGFALIFIGFVLQIMGMLL